MTHPFSPDGKRLLATVADVRPYGLFSLEGGAFEDIGLSLPDLPIRWSSDGRYVFYRSFQDQRLLYRLDLQHAAQGSLEEAALSRCLELRVLGRHHRRRPGGRLQLLTRAGRPLARQGLALGQASLVRGRQNKTFAPSIARRGATKRRRLAEIGRGAELALDPLVSIVVEGVQDVREEGQFDPTAQTPSPSAGGGPRDSSSAGADGRRWARRGWWCRGPGPERAPCRAQGLPL